MHNKITWIPSNKEPFTIYSGNTVVDRIYNNTSWRDFATIGADYSNTWVKATWQDYSETADEPEAMNEFVELE